jgi:protein-tyrosine-phosphatase
LLDAEGMGPLGNAKVVAGRLGIDLGPHRSRALRSGYLADADLVVGFEPVHAIAAAEVGGAPAEHVFLLLELPELLEALPRSQLSDEEGTRWAIRELQRLRTVAGWPRRASSLPDPLGEPEQVFAETARVIDAVTRALARAVLPGRGALSAFGPAE